MSDLGSIMSGLSGERKTPKGEGKHYIPFSNDEWNALAKGFGRTPDMLEPKQIKALVQGMVSGKVGLYAKISPTDSIETATNKVSALYDIAAETEKQLEALKAVKPV